MEWKETADGYVCFIKTRNEDEIELVRLIPAIYHPKIAVYRSNKKKWAIHPYCLIGRFSVSVFFGTLSETKHQAELYIRQLSSILLSGLDENYKNHIEAQRHRVSEKKSDLIARYPLTINEAFDKEK